MKKLLFLLIPFFIIITACQPRVIDKPESTVPKIRVLIHVISNMDSIEFKGEYLLKSEEADYVFGGNNRKIYVKPLEKGYSVFNRNRIFRLTAQDHIIFSPSEPSSTFQLGKTEYSGELHISFSADQGVQIVNKINMETYLRGVVPAEIPSYKETYLEAVKAQAICARTYALKRMERRQNIFDVYGDVRDQVYSGITAQSRMANQAIDFTRGSALMYGTDLAEIYYHSTCGGLSEASENVWKDAILPYMNVRQDALGDRFACQNSPAFRWRQNFSMTEIDSLFKLKFNYSQLDREITDTTTIVLSIESLRRSSGGRIQNLSISYGDTTVSLQGLEIRHFFSKKGRSLKSAMFTMKTEGDSLLIIDGGGYGHGAGMCQYGALYMSERGFKYYDILVNKYYRGTYLKKVY